MPLHLRSTLTLTTLCLILSSCTTAPSLQEDADEALQEDANKALLHRYFEDVHNEGDLDAIEQLTSPGFVFHFGGQTDTVSYEEHKGVVRYWREGLDGYHVSVEDLIADGDRVVARVAFRGDHRGTVLGVEPTGRTVSSTGMWICRVEEERLHECWEEYDVHGLTQQLEAAPRP